MIKLVVFDWNGTLLSDTKECMAADNHVIKHFGGKKVNIKTYRDTIIIPSNTFYTKHGCEMKELVKQSKRLGQIFHSFYESKSRNCHLRKGTQELFKWLHLNSVSSIILSNHTVRGIKFQLKKFGIIKYFKKILANIEMDASMKERNKLEKLKNYIRKSGYKKSEILIVGDSPEESEIAKSLGIKAALITNGYYSTTRLKESKPDYLINELVNLKKIVGSRN